jgi:hypothetical protein
MITASFYQGRSHKELYWRIHYSKGFLDTRKNFIGERETREVKRSWMQQHIEIKNHLPGSELAQVLLQSEYIISRSGYTTVMELLSLQKKSILIPTPGQTEQEYLAKKLQIRPDLYECGTG